MRLTKFFLPILKKTPKEAEIVFLRLMPHSGMMRQQVARIYSWLPLGLYVIQKVEEIVHEEQNRAGAVELLMSIIQPTEIWQEIGRYYAYGKEMLRIDDRDERKMLRNALSLKLPNSGFKSSFEDNISENHDYH